MLAILQPFCPPSMVGIARSLSSGGTSAQATVAVPVEQERTTPLHPLTGLVAEPEAKQVILEMLLSGTPEPVIRSIFNTGYYEIIIPHELADTPYIAITYTNDTEEGHIYDTNVHPPQDYTFLTTPNPEMTADERGDWDWDPQDTWDGFQWGSIGPEEDTIPSPVLYTIAEFEHLEPVSGLEIYFSGCDGQSLLCPSVDHVEPWYRSSSPGREVWIRDWSDEYELGDLQTLDVDGLELEQDSSVSSESGDLDMETEFSD